MISRPKPRNQFLFLVHKGKQDRSSRAKNLALTLWWQLTNKISGTQYHHKLIFYLPCHVPRRVLGGATKVEPGTIRVGGERLLVITGALIATTVTQRALRCHYRWYLFLLHWIIKSSIHLSCPRFVNSHRALHLTQLMSCKLLQYTVGLFLIRQIPCHRCPPMTEGAIFMDAWLMYLSCYFSKAMAAQISRLKNPHTSLHTYAKNVPEATRKKIYTAANGQ